MPTADDATRERLFAGMSGQAGDARVSLPALLGTAFGTGPRGGVNVTRAAQTFGVSPRTVQRWISGASRPADEAAVRAKALAAAAFGTGPRGGVNTAAAAAQFGVSRSTVYRWLRGPIPPRRADQLTTAAATATSASPAGRAAASHGLRAAIKDRMRRDPVTGAPRPYQRQKVQLVVSGVQDRESGPRSAIRRKRPIAIPLGPGHVDALFDAWEQGGDQAAINYIENAASALYLHYDDTADPEALADEDYPDKAWWLNQIDDLEWVDDPGAT